MYVATCRSIIHGYFEPAAKSVHEIISQQSEAIVGVQSVLLDQSLRKQRLVKGREQNRQRCAL